MKHHKILEFLSQHIYTFIFAWLLLSLTVDTMVIPTVFRTLKNPELGGLIGIKIFPMINTLEVILGGFFFLGLIPRLNIKTQINHRVLLVISLIVVKFAFLFRFYLSPSIRDLTLKLHSMKSAGETQIENAEYLMLKTEHSSFHHLYVNLEKIKVFLLLILCLWLFWESWKKFSLAYKNSRETSKEISKETSVI